MISRGPPGKSSELNIFPSSVGSENDGRVLILSAVSLDFNVLTMIPPASMRKIMADGSYNQVQYYFLHD